MEGDNPNQSRRQMMGGVATGLIGAAIAPVAAQAAATPPAVGLVDPRTAYPQPPFPVQQQPWTGLTSKMDPRPDHGEK